MDPLADRVSDSGLDVISEQTLLADNLVDEPRRWLRSVCPDRWDHPGSLIPSTEKQSRDVDHVIEVKMGQEQVRYLGWLGAGIHHSGGSTRSTIEQYSVVAETHKKR